MNLLERLEATAINYRLEADEIDTAIKIIKKLGLEIVKSGKKKKKRKKMSPAARKAIGIRMRKYWAERRKEKK